MKLEEAIEILEKHTNPDNFAQYGAWELAQRLGIEALKRVQRERQDSACYADGLLPAKLQTKEENKSDHRCIRKNKGQNRLSRDTRFAG